MIVRITGKIISLEPLSMVLDVQGISYALQTTLHVYEAYHHRREDVVTIFTRLLYSNDNQPTLYGFHDEEEARMFDFLKSLSGVGGQTAVNLISYLGVPELDIALQNNDLEKLKKAPRIGKAKAEKIIFEASRKRHSNRSAGSSSSEKSAEPVSMFMAALEEVLSGLGFQKKEMDSATRKLDFSTDPLPDKKPENLDKWIKLYLKNL